MNNEFQWRNEMRKLGGAVDPARDLWPAIAARVASAPAVASAHTRRRSAMAIAAALVVIAGAATTVYRWREVQTVRTSAVAQVQSPASAAAGAETPAATTAELPRTALDWAVPADPQLATTAENLDTASAQLQDALEQRPDAVFLVGLLNRTNAQRLRLMRKSPYAG